MFGRRKKKKLKEKEAKFVVKRGGWNNFLLRGENNLWPKLKHPNTENLKDDFGKKEMFNIL